jgi:hypothetical protein
MNAVDVLHYGHGTVLATIEGLPEADWLTPGVCGVWSVKDLIAHLTSFEWVLAEVLGSWQGGGMTPTLDRMRADAAAFNDDEVGLRAGQTVSEALAEYKTVHEQVAALIGKVPELERSRPGTLPWYGDEYALDDYIVYAQYGHKREHCAQIAVFRDGLGA